MLGSSLVLLALAATGFAQVTAPEGYRKVYMTSNVDKKFVIVGKSPVKAGGTLVVQTLTSKPDQQWWLQNGKTRIQLVDTTLCMDAGATKSAWKDMAPINLQECSETADGQKWEVKADGRIALDLSPAPQQCIDLVYMRATQNNPVGLYTCAGLGNTGAADKGINWPLVNVTTTP